MTSIEMLKIIIGNFCGKTSALARKIYGLPRSHLQKAVFYLPGIVEILKESLD
ncbi:MULTISPECIES: hypothetical protein [unclassified Microcoleus]|uniref:hypothetical protein n=1 Tax=unclassified Microcoleus TaxID=2642155 RepID=UPI003B16F9DB